MAELTTIAAVKTYIGESTTTFDALLSTTLASVEQMIGRFCNRRDGFVSATKTERFDGEWGEQVVLTYVPVTSVTSVKVYTSNTQTVTLDSSLYLLDPDTHSGVLGLISAPDALWDAGYDFPAARSTFPGGFRNIQVVYVGGWASNAIPADLQQLAIEFTATVFRRRRVDQNMMSESEGNYSYTLVGVNTVIGRGGVYEDFRSQLDALGYVRHGVFTP